MKHKGIVIRQTEEVISVACDVCGKIHEGNEIPNDWLVVKSVYDFYDHFEEEEDEVCSPECYLKHLQGVCDTNDEETKLIVNGMSINFIENLLKQIDSLLGNIKHTSDLFKSITDKNPDVFNNYDSEEYKNNNLYNKSTILKMLNKLNPEEMKQVFDFVKPLAEMTDEQKESQKELCERIKNMSLNNFEYKNPLKILFNANDNNE